MDDDATLDEGFYKQLRQRIRAWAQTEEGARHAYLRYVLIAPDFFHLLCRLALDPRVPIKSKSRLAAAIAYFVSPVDLLPEGVLGPLGYLDDVALTAYVLNLVVNQTDEAVVRELWAGDGDVLDVIREVLEAADDMLGRGVWNSIREKFRGTQAPEEDVIDV